jgi:hypothetical protein
MAEFHRHSSWGRTRGPKNVAGSVGTEVVTSTDLPTAVTDGHSTENQRYLHMLIDTTTSNEDRTATVYGWNHAFGVWFVLTDSSGTNITLRGNNAQVYKLVEIFGVDRVYFRMNGALAANDEFFAAGSTF